MAKLTAWLVTIIGILLVLWAAGLFALEDAWVQWVLAILVLAIGVGKLARNYKTSKKKR